VFTVLNWVAVGVLLVALVLACLAWAGRVRFDRRPPGDASRAAGRAFAVLEIGALLQAVAQLVDGGARWIVGPVGLVLVVVGAVLVFRLRRRAAVPR
jgi:low temperature requirement protein LtrA